MRPALYHYNVWLTASLKVVGMLPGVGHFFVSMESQIERATIQCEGTKAYGGGRRRESSTASP